MLLILSFWNITWLLVKKDMYFQSNTYNIKKRGNILIACKERDNLAAL